MGFRDQGVGCGICGVVGCGDSSCVVVWLCCPVSFPFLSFSFFSSIECSLHVGASHGVRIVARFVVDVFDHG